VGDNRITGYQQRREITKQEMLRKALATHRYSAASPVGWVPSTGHSMLFPEPHNPFLCESWSPLSMPSEASPQNHSLDLLPSQRGIHIGTRVLDHPPTAAALHVCGICNLGRNDAVLRTMAPTHATPALIRTGIKGRSSEYA
jgi:hypothetical protein